MTIAETFDEQYRVDPTTGCHIWLRAKHQNGYGHLTIDGKKILAHRYAWFRKHGKWPKPCALHKCDNHPCVNEAHLFEGTKKDNTQDMIAKGRLIVGRRVRGENNVAAKLTDEKVREIRKAFSSGESIRSIARRQTVSRPVVQGVCHGTSWAHVTA